LADDKHGNGTKHREFIESIQNRQTRSDKEFILDSLTGAIDRLQKVFPRYGSFLMEFVQNADDAESTALRIEINNGSVTISNNGKPFSEENVKSICKVGRSSKTPKDYIGYLGVGFKSSFLISDSPEIRSGGFSFKFDKNAWTDPSHTPWQVIPLWVDDAEQESPDFTTVFKLPVKDITLLQRIREEIRPEELNDRMSLFLRHIKEIEITDKGQNFNRKIVKSLISETSEYQIYRIKEYLNGQLEHEDDWLLFRQTSTVPTEVKQDYVTKDWEREGVDNREVIVAFKLEGGKNIAVEKKGTAHIGVFSFLPLKEVPSGLNFLIQADFLTTPGRGELARESKWNNWIAGEIYKLIVNKCIPVFLNSKIWKMSFIPILYSVEGGHELFEQFIKRPLRSYLETAAVLIDEDGSPITPHQALSIGREVREILSNEDLNLLYPGRKVVHRACKVGNIPNIGKGPQNLLEFVSSWQALTLMKQKAAQDDHRWFKVLYSSLNSYEGAQLSVLRYVSFMLTAQKNLSYPAGVYINPNKISIPPEVAGNFTLVHDSLASDKSLSEFFTKLEIIELTDKHVQDFVRVKEIPQISKSWSSFSDREKLEKLVLCEELWKKMKIQARDLSFLTLKTKSGKWLDPKQILFSKEYSPTQDIESLVEKGLYDKELDFLSAEFSARPDKSDWINFFKELGVGNFLEKNEKSIVQRVGVKLALLYETKNGRTPTEVGESAKPGYDILSKSDEETRDIEVKASKEASPYIFITAKEFAKLKDDKENYFIYVVTDALRTPVLHSISGSKVTEAEFTISLAPALWKSLSADEFHL
jgi:hypothetical protein